MPSADKQKKQRSPSRKAKGRATRRTRRSEMHSNIAIEQFMNGRRPELKVAKVERAFGDGYFNLKRGSTTYSRARVAGALGLTRKAAKNPAIRTAIEAGDYVLTDGARIHAKLTGNEIRQAKEHDRSGSHSGSASANSLFSAPEYRAAGVEAAVAGEKAGHKAASRSRSRSASRSASTSRSGSGSSIVLKKVKLTQPQHKKEAKGGL